MPKDSDTIFSGSQRNPKLESVASLQWGWGKGAGFAGRTGLQHRHVKEKVSLLKKKKKKLLMAMQFPARAPSLRNSEDPFQTGMRPGRMLVF